MTYILRTVWWMVHVDCHCRGVTQAVPGAMSYVPASCSTLSLPDPMHIASSKSPVWPVMTPGAHSQMPTSTPSYPHSQIVFAGAPSEGIGTRLAVRMFWAYI